MKEWFTLWFQDGGGRTAIHGRRELRKFAKRFDFNADEVISKGETFIEDQDAETIGGVFRETA